MPPYEVISPVFCIIDQQSENMAVICRDYDPRSAVQHSVGSIWSPSAICQIMLRLESERGLDTLRFVGVCEICGKEYKGVLLYRISDYLDWNFRFRLLCVC